MATPNLCIIQVTQRMTTTRCGRDQDELISTESLAIRLGGLSCPALWEKTQAGGFCSGNKSVNHQRLRLVGRLKFIQSDIRSISAMDHHAITQDQRLAQWKRDRPIAGINRVLHAALGA